VTLHWEPAVRADGVWVVIQLQPRGWDCVVVLSGPGEAPVMLERARRVAAALNRIYAGAGMAPAGH